MKHIEKHPRTAQSIAGDIYPAYLLGRLHNDRLIETDGDSDLYVAELARRISMHDREDEQSETAFDWIN